MSVLPSHPLSFHSLIEEQLQRSTHRCDLKKRLISRSVKWMLNRQRSIINEGRICLKWVKWKLKYFFNSDSTWFAFRHRIYHCIHVSAAVAAAAAIDNVHFYFLFKGSQIKLCAIITMVQQIYQTYTHLYLYKVIKCCEKSSEFETTNCINALGAFHRFSLNVCYFHTAFKCTAHIHIHWK